jgi:hypothetical protein
MDVEKEVFGLQKAMAAAEEQHRTIFRRLDKSEKLADSVSELALSVRDLVNAQTNTEKKITTLCKDVAEIKDKPAKRWESLGMEMFKIVIAAVAGLVLAKTGIV